MEKLDEKLLRKAKHGNPEALEKITGDFLVFAYQAAHEVHGVPEAEANSAAHVGLLHAIKTYKFGCGIRFATHVATQVKYHAMRARRSCARHVRVESAYVASQGFSEPTCESSLEAEEIAAKRREFMAGEISKIPEREQIMVNGRLSGRSYPDIADEIGCKQELVKFLVEDFFENLVIPQELKGAV